MAEAPRTGRLARSAITGLAAARIGMAELGHRARPRTAEARARHEAEVGRILFGALGQLRGTALKVSQVLSMHPELLPEGIRRELARAHHQAPPLNRALVGRVFRQAFGCEPQALYDHFEPDAFAAASLGQVHRARLAGHGAVAVKVQYPGIAATIGSDIQLMRSALRALAHTDLPMPALPVVDGIMDEIEATLLREVDYQQEAAQQQWFAQHAAWPGLRIAQPVMSHTRAQVLTQQYLDGLPLEAWLATEPAQSVRDRAGQRLWDWFLHCTFVLGQVHADPHPGNFVFADDGTVGVLDFGCTRPLGSAFTAQVAQAWAALLLPVGAPRRDAHVLQAYQGLGLVADDLPLPTYTAELAPALAEMQAWQIEPFTQACFDFSAKAPPPITPARHQRVLGRHLRQVPGEMPAFERMWMGLMHLLTRLGARVHTRTAHLAPSPVAPNL